jgi:hypothetical protein
VGIAVTSTGRGYWLVGADGGVFAFGDAPFLGSLGATRLKTRIVAMAATTSGRGYWLADGGGTAIGFGDAPTLTIGDVALARPITAAATSSRAGLWPLGADGGAFALGDAPFFGASPSADRTTTAVALVPFARGYWIVTRTPTA